MREAPLLKPDKVTVLDELLTPMLPPVRRLTRPAASTLEKEPDTLVAPVKILKELPEVIVEPNPLIRETLRLPPRVSVPVMAIVS